MQRKLRWEKEGRCYVKEKKKAKKTGVPEEGKKKKERRHQTGCLCHLTAARMVDLVHNSSGRTSIKGGTISKTRLKKRNRPLVRGKKSDKEHANTCD